MTKPYLFYGVDLSLYSGKLRAYLRFKGIPYEEQAPSFATYNFTIKRKTGDPVIPVLVSPQGEWMQDTSEIIETMERRFPAVPVLPASPVQRFAAQLFELWGDEFWLPTAMHMRWNHPKENYALFEHDICDAFFPNLPHWLTGFIVKYGVARKLHGFLRVLGVTPKTAPLLDQWTCEQLDALDRHFAVQPFLLGTRPSLGDLGLIGPLFAHLGRDPWPKKHLIDPRKHLSAWVDRMMNPTGDQGAFLPDDQLAPTLAPMLRSLFREMTPFLASAARELRSVAPAYKVGQRLPRHFGLAHCPRSNGQWSQQVLPYTLWMAQRILDNFKQLPHAEAAQVRTWLKSVGGEKFLQLHIPRLRRSGLRAALDS